MQEVKNSIIAYSKQLESKPSASLYADRAKSFAVLGDSDSTLNDLTKAVNLESNNSEVHNQLALAQIHKGDYESAEAAAKKAHEINANTDYLHWMIASEGNRLTQKIKTSPTAALYNKRGLVSLYQGALEPAKADFEKAIELDKGLVPAYANLAHTLLKLAQPQEAEKVLDEISDQNPDFKSDDILIAKKWSFLEKKVQHSPNVMIYKELAAICLSQETILPWEKAQEYLSKAQELTDKATPLNPQDSNQK